MKILLIDDDPSIYQIIKKSLNSLVSLDYMERMPNTQLLHSYDLILLDLMLENQNSLDFLKDLQDEESILLSRIILLTGAGSVEDEIETHRLGVRDYVKKPFNPKVLAALVDKHIGQLKTSGGIKYGPFLLNLTDYSIYLPSSKQPLELTKTEFDVLKMLIESRGRVVTRERLMNEVWDMNDEIQTRTVDMHMSSLRKKIHPFGDHLKTKRGIGYYLEEKLIEGH